LINLKHQLVQKYPNLRLLCEDASPRIRGWKAQETFLLTLPVFLSPREKKHLEYFVSVAQELIQSPHDPESAELILDKLLERETLRPSAQHLESHMRLLNIKKIAESQINGSGLNRADESFFKDLFIVPHGGDKQAKFKPLHPFEAAKEVHAYHCDRMLGMGLTAPTMLLKTPNLAVRLETIRQLFHSAALCSNRTIIVDENCIRGKDIIGAQWLREKAFSLFKSSDIPNEVRDHIFGEMFHLCGASRQIDQLGEFLFFGKPGFEVEDKYRECAMQRYTQSQIFKEHQSKFSKIGSIQLWQNDCGRAFDYIVYDKNGGAKLKTAPKTLVHSYALLGIIKGSMDCSSGNSLVQFDCTKNAIGNFWDMDDELSMPMSNDFWHIRLWQLGLPQCAQPFDRAFLLLFTDPRLLDKLKQLQHSANIPDTTYKAQVERLSRIIDTFRNEVSKPKIELTPRDLFFLLFGGRKEFEEIKKIFNNDKTYGAEGIRISPIELFEFHLPEIGRNSWYSGDENEKRTVGENMRALYHPDLP